MHDVDVTVVSNPKAVPSVRWERGAGGGVFPGALPLEQRQGRSEVCRTLS